MLYEIKPSPEVLNDYFVQIIRLIAAKTRIQDAEWKSAPELLEEVRDSFPEVHKAILELHGSYQKWATACLEGKQGTPEMIPLILDRDNTRRSLVWAVDTAERAANIGRPRN